MHGSTRARARGTRSVYVYSLDSITAIGFKGQRNNNNRGGGRRPGFEAIVYVIRVQLAALVAPAK